MFAPHPSKQTISSTTVDDICCAKLKVHQKVRKIGSKERSRVSVFAAYLSEEINQNHARLDLILDEQIYTHFRTLDFSLTKFNWCY